MTQSWLRPFLAIVGLLSSPFVGAESATGSGVRAQPFGSAVFALPEAGGITFSPDGATAYFGAKIPGGRGIMFSHLREGKWGKPQLALFSGGYVDGDPQMAPDGGRLFFWSVRPVPGKPNPDGADLWYVERQDEAWSAPHLVGAGPNGEWSPLTLWAGTPSPAADGTLYFFRAVGRDRFRIVRSKPVDGRYRIFEDLGDTINGRDDGGFDVTVAPDQSFVIFCCSKRPDSLGLNDLYISYREDEGWSEPRNLGPGVNTSGQEYSPTLSPDGETLFFSRDGIMSIPLAACDGVRARPKATLFAEGVISTGESAGATFAPDGNTAYFCRPIGTGPEKRGALMVSRRSGETWSAPEIVPISGQFNDFDPALSPDGTCLFYCSMRPDADMRPAVWVSERTADGWGPPRSLAAITGADGVAVFPWVTANGNLYFGGHAPGLASQGDDDIFVCRKQPDGGYGAPENLGAAINSPAPEYDAYVAPDESFLVFASRRPGGLGKSDLYLSERRDGAWRPARNLGPLINSMDTTWTGCPSVSPDGRWFYFSSNRAGKPGIYRIEASALGLTAR